ncbi:UPF0187 domain membrane protein [Massarina eburnea CBS 473.64]|uniref:UPF0187 domain membrane protein n=1 Tax=Massarina eburnea CBS 473.64 TaxID=1395130 RepID=A0A6A6S3G3_9PLEO|nr:UPF0187 domain membrane protein [Massarina eburnea CBS 473.64]
MGISPTSWFKHKRAKKHTPFGYRSSRERVETYFWGPRDISRHSRWPRALRIHGSVAPKLIIPMFCIACWTALIVVISEKVYSIDVHPIVITVLGLVVGLALNFRSNSAYERYMDGRKMWSALGATSTSLARHIWLHVHERREVPKSDLMDKITALNLIIAFVIALKHKLRFEPYTQYEDLNDLVSHLETFAAVAGEPTATSTSGIRDIGEMLNIPMARSNPRREIKKAEKPLGNLPLELLSYISAYLAEVFANGTFTLGIAQNHAMNNMNDLHTILATTDRVLNTPVPVAYSICISQITWLYVLTLPFQLVQLTEWLTIPITILTSYIILSILSIGNEIENPFGTEVNDLPMEIYCAQITSDIAIIASISPAQLQQNFKNVASRPLYPISSAPASFWKKRPEQEIREALRFRATVSKGTMWKRMNNTSSTLMRLQNICFRIPKSISFHSCGLNSVES